MKRWTLVFIMAFTLFIALATSCDTDNPFEPNNPSPSALTGLTQNQTTAELSWTTNPDTDFASYTLYRSDAANIQSNSGNATILTVITDKNVTLHHDENLTPGSIWFYVIRTANSYGGTTWSNEVSVTLPTL